jgi:hypothetical protein
VRLRHDVGYARESDTPKAVTAADIVAGKVDDNRYVTVEAPPDRAGAVRLRTTKGSDGHRVVAVRGTSDRLWLALPGDAWGHEAQHDDRVSGRLRRLADVRYAGPLARALAAYPSPRFITGAELRRARTENASQVTLIDGATLALGADADVDLSVVDPNAAIVVAALSEGHPTTAAWAEALAAAGVIAPGQAPIASTADLARWEVRRPDAVAAVQALLDQAQLAGARRRRVDQPAHPVRRPGGDRRRRDQPGGRHPVVGDRRRGGVGAAGGAGRRVGRAGRRAPRRLLVHAADLRRPRADRRAGAVGAGARHAATVLRSVRPRALTLRPPGRYHRA